MLVINVQYLRYEFNCSVLLNETHYKNTRSRQMDTFQNKLKKQ